MSLRVWLPLNGDLHNQGLSDITVTNNGTTVNNNGKIGSCYSFNGSNQKITGTFSSSISSAIGSLACWVKFNSLPSSSAWFNLMQLGATGGFAACRLGMYVEYGTGINISINGSSTGANYKAYSFSTGTWYHICAVYDGTKVKLYINGAEQLNKTASVGSYTTAANMLFIGGTSNYYLNGYVNDCRYYNHALSELEVKEISRGLILHYPLNQFLPYQSIKYDKNIYIEPDGSKWLHIIHHNNPNGGVFSSTDTWESGVYIDENRWFDFYPIIRILNTYEFMVKQKTTSSATEVKYRWIQNKSPLTATYNDIQPSNVTRITTTGYTDGNYGGLYVTNNNSHLCIANTNNGNWYGALGCWKVYQNGIPGYPNTVITTGYMDLYIKISDYISSTIEYDISGYCNNGTKIGTFTYSTDTPKYSLSTVFNGNNYNKHVSPCIEARTISLWVKWASIPSGQSVIYVDQKSKTGLGLMSTGILVNTNQTGNTFSKSNIVANTWYHFVIVSPNGSSNATRKLYINSIEQNTTSSTSSWTFTLDELQIGKRSTTSDGFNGQLSDFRIYATALSAQDILSLYHNSALVDEQGNIHGAIH